MQKKILSILLALLLAVAALPIGAAAAGGEGQTPTDILKSTAEEYGLLRYFQVTDFGAPITRLELCQLLAGVMGAEIDTSAAVDLPYQPVDCDGLTTEERAVVKWCLERGFIGTLSVPDPNDPDNEFARIVVFQPSNAHARAEGVIFFWSILGRPETSDTIYFVDVGMNSGYARHYIAPLAELGIFYAELENGEYFEPNVRLSQWDALRWAVACYEVLHFGQVTTRHPLMGALGPGQEEFVIDENGVLTAYNGEGGGVVIPPVSAIDGAFRDSYGVMGITVPEGTETITDAFSFCSSLRSVNLPASLTAINGDSFNWCTSLTDVYYAGTEEQWEQISIYTDFGANEPLFNADIHYNCPVPDLGGITYKKTEGYEGEGPTLFIYGDDIPDFHDYYQIPWRDGWNPLDAVVIETTVSKIGSYAFAYLYCKDLSIPSTVNSIGAHAFDRSGYFDDGDLMESLVLHEGLQSIDEYAFNSFACRTITLPASLTQCASTAFANTEWLKEVYYAGSEEEFKANGLDHVGFGENVTIYYDGKKPADEVPDLGSVTYRIEGEGPRRLIISGSGPIPDYSDFYQSPWSTDFLIGKNEPAESITIEPGITRIGAYSFAGVCCRELNIPSTVTSIGDYAFSLSGCGDGDNESPMDSVTIPEGVQSIGAYAFSHFGSKAICLPVSLTQCDPTAFLYTGTWRLEDIYYAGSEAEFKANGLDKTGYGDNVTVHYNSTGPAPKPAFTDVKPGDYFADSVSWAMANAVTSGTSATTFSPNQTCTRKEMVTFLWNAMGKPDPASTNNPFVDVKPTDYFYKAVLWAVENKITAGADATHFNPHGKCTRKEAVTFLWRTAGSPTGSPASSFSDVRYIPANEWYTKAIDWAVANKITSGTSKEKNTFSPEDTCTRAQIVTFLYNAKGLLK